MLRFKEHVTVGVLGTSKNNHELQLDSRVPTQSDQTLGIPCCMQPKLSEVRRLEVK